ncbi:MAG: prepilin-type N-terminal cleavage/methylation domain-containing protein [Phycisphaerales bacterium]|nr:prepilin-type N-terminal cleavage/methylation domain-containing protein [Phycisphaerales bacterium]
MRARAGGFTLLEVMLSLALAALVVSGVFGLLGLMNNQMRVSEATFADTGGLYRTQTVVRRALQTMIAGEPTALDAGGGDAGDLDPENDDVDADLEALRADLESVVGADDAASIMDRRSELLLPHFELAWDDPEPGVVVPVVEVVVLESPVPVDTSDMGDAEREMTLRDSAVESYRGMFEVARDDLVPERWNLRWTPIDPPMRPMVLIRDVIPESVAWMVLPLKREEGARDPWVTGVFAAYLAEDFPLAVRLVFRTNSGAQADWVFEVAVAEVTQ